MSKSRIMVVEDEPLIADDIANTLSSHDYQVVGIADEAAEALKIMEAEDPHLALLDINIEGEMDGIELASRLAIPFVFLTSYYDQDTLERAKKTRPYGYVVKPFNENELVANIEMALYRTKQPEGRRVLPDKLFVRRDQEIIAVMSSDIIFVEAFDNYANLYTNEDKFIISHTLKSIEQKLLPLGFERVHRSYLINFDAIDSISEGNVFLNGHKVPLGKSYRKDFMDKLAML